MQCMGAQQMGMLTASMISIDTVLSRHMQEIIIVGGLHSLGLHIGSLRCMYCFRAFWASGCTIHIDAHSHLEFASK